MIPTIYRRPDASTDPTALFDPDPTALAVLVVDDPLSGAVPTWRMHDDGPEWAALVAELGDPSRGAVDVRVVPMSAPPADVVDGELVDGPPTVLPTRKPARKRAPRKRVAS